MRLVVTSPTGEPALVDLGAAAGIEQALRAWHTAVLQQGEGREAAWQQLATLLWQPLVPVLPPAVRKVWVSPDGELARLPWHLLAATAPRTQNWLVTQITSARELAALRRFPPSRAPNAPRTLLLAGGIDFDVGALEPSTVRSGSWAPLPGTVVEVAHLGALGQTQRFAVTAFTGAAASKAAVLAAMPQATYAHLATHGFFTQSAPAPLAISGRGLFRLDMPRPAPSTRHPLAESGLVLAGGNVRDAATAATPGLLTAAELVGLDLRQTVLVTLSACETGGGRATTGQGVLGLQAALLAAGARSVLMSLWNVPDDATTRLMEAFYTALWSEGLSPAVALQRAQDAVRREPRFAAPIHWAPGSWRGRAGRVRRLQQG